ncbi:MAG: hypothetical protein Q4E39_00730 [bacterium]|nr:hypothetical protein [bacterium]
MKKFLVNIRSYRDDKLCVLGKNKREAERILKDILNKTNLLSMISPREANYIYTIREEENAKKNNS